MGGDVLVRARQLYRASEATDTTRFVAGNDAEITRRQCRCLPWISIDGAGRKEVRDRIYAAALVLCLKAERRAARCQSQHRNGVCSPLTRLADTHPEPVAAEFRRFYQRPV